MNTINEKILLLLSNGVDFVYAYSPGKKWRALEKTYYQWRNIDNRELVKGIQNLYKLKEIEKQENKKGFIKINLTKKGKLKLLNYSLENIKNKNIIWDKKWRMVAFDIPEKFKKSRDILRSKLNKIGFCKLQKSVFITPYDCKKELLLFIKFFNLEQYICFGVLDFINKEDDYKKIFKLK